MGRPLKEIDAEQVYRLAKLGCTQDEIAEFFGTTQSVISERFRSEFDLGRGASKISLRRLQWKRAKAGSDAMLIHLGKVYLGQTDKLDLTSKGEALETRVIILPDNGRDPTDGGDQAAAGPPDPLP